MENKIGNLENLDLSEWDFDIDLDSVCESAVKVFLSEADISVWFPGSRKNPMDARFTMCAHVDVCNSINPYIDINMTSFLSEGIEESGDYLREGDVNEKARLEIMKADMLSLISQIDGELLKYEQANTKD